MPKKILIVDDEPANLSLMERALEGEGYTLAFATNGKEALAVCVAQHQPDLVLLDILMPEMDGYNVCRRLKSSSRTSRIPVIFVSAKGEVDDEEEGFEVGAVDYITKPISPTIVRSRVRTHLSLIRSETLEETVLATVHMLGEAGHYNDEDTGAHIWRMAAYAKAIALAFGWSEESADVLETAALMHDTGKIGIPDSILKAPRSLSAEEWVTMRKHTEIGFDILSKSDLPLFRMARDIAYCHHERWDGTGYPKGLRNTLIPESARIVAIADVFDALTTKRVYKEAWPVDKAFHEIAISSGSHFDPDLAEVFLSIRDVILEIKQKWEDYEAS